MMWSVFSITEFINQFSISQKYTDLFIKP